jgi:hypothetical protein
MLASGASRRAVARHFGYNQPTMNNHANKHSGARLIEHNLIEPTLVRIRALNLKTLRILQNAEDQGDPQTALNAIRESRHNLRLIAELTGALRSSHQNPQEPVEVRIVYVDAKPN